MKKIIVCFLLICSASLWAQKDCEYATNVTDSLGTYKATKDVLMHQRFFGNDEKTLFFSLINSNDLPSLKIQLIQKSSEFIPAVCLDETSRVFIQLENGKIITLISINQTDCGNSVSIDGKNCRILTGYFVFMKDTLEELKSSKMNLLRIKYSSEVIDYIIKDELTSEIDKTASKPADFFSDFLKCVE